MSRKHREKTNRKQCELCGKLVPTKYLTPTFGGHACQRCLGMDSLPMKVCPRCGEEKSLAEFGIRKKRGTADSWCKECRSEHNMMLRSQSGYKEKHAAYMREYRRRKREETS